MPKPIIALVGRPNVGKSTLFNRIVGERIAIVEDVAGTTRDRLYYDADWNGRTFTLVDTGGLEIEPGSDIAQRVREQAELAVDEADLILFMVDAQLGITGGDLEVASLLRQTQKPVLVVANKADTARGRFDSVEFYRLGLKDVYPISALHGTGTGDLLDAVVTRMPAFPEEEAPVEEGVRVAFVGRPNVGKSSLLNAIVGRERAVVTEIPGTTRDTIDVGIEVDGRKMVLVDTAGVRRRGRIEVGVERYSVIRSIRAIERADVVAVIIDASEGVTAQDTHLAGFARDEAKGILLAVNKWDLVPQTNVTQEEWTLKVREEFKFVPFAPLLFLSARQHWHVTDVVNTVFRISEERHKRVPTAGLNDIVEEAVHAHSPGAPHGRQLKIFYATQVTVNPPTFVFFVNDSSLLQFSYQRYLENRLRQAFGFEGTAVRMFFRNRVATQTEKR